VRRKQCKTKIQADLSSSEECLKFPSRVRVQNVAKTGTAAGQE